MTNDDLKYYKNRIKKDLKKYNKYPYLFDFMKSFEDIDYVPYLDFEEISIPNEYLLSLTNDFYMSTPFYDSFLKSLKTIKVAFYDNDPELGCTGSYDYIFDQINIYKRNDFFDIVTLSHEFAHAFIYDINPNYEEYCLGPFDETISLFFELLCAKFHENSEFSHHTLVYYHNELNFYLNYLKAITMELRILKDYPVVDESYYQALKIFLDNKVIKCYKYIIGYIISMNLIYKDDIEYSSYIINKLIDVDKNSSVYNTFLFLDKNGLFNDEGLRKHRDDIKIQSLKKI